MRHLASAQYWDWPAGGNTGRLFLMTGLAIVHWIGCINAIKLQIHYVIADPKVGEQHIYRKYFKCNIFQVTTDLLNSENLRIAITQLCHELHVSNFTML